MQKQNILQNFILLSCCKVLPFKVKFKFIFQFKKEILKRFKLLCIYYYTDIYLVQCKRFLIF